MRGKGRPIVKYRHTRPDSFKDRRCINHLITCLLTYRAKTAEPIEIPFSFRARIGPRNPVLDWVPDTPIGRSNF